MIEEIKRLKSKLQLETTSTEEMVECLNKLGQKIPPRHVMLDTKIGEIVVQYPILHIACLLKLELPNSPSVIWPRPN